MCGETINQSYNNETEKAYLAVYAFHFLAFGKFIFYLYHGYTTSEKKK